MTTRDELVMSYLLHWWLYLLTTLMTVWWHSQVSTRKATSTHGYTDDHPRWTSNVLLTTLMTVWWHSQVSMRKATSTHGCTVYRLMTTRDELVMSYLLHWWLFVDIVRCQWERLKTTRNELVMPFCHSFCFVDNNSFMNW